LSGRRPSSQYLTNTSAPSGGMAIGRLAAVVSTALLSGSATALRRKDDACTCKNWKQTYATGAARCGQTNEYFETTKMNSLSSEMVEAAYEYLGAQFCAGFFEAMDDNACVNVGMKEYRGQWCYVDASCSNLNGGVSVNNKLSWKLCTDGEDKMLRHYSPPDLLKLAEDNHLEMGLTNKMAYTVGAYRWKYISAFWEDADIEYITSTPSNLGVSLADLRETLRVRWGKRHRDIDPEMKAELQKYVDSGVPIVFDTAKDQHPPHVIIQGKSVWVALSGASPSMVCVTGCKH